MRWFFNRPLKSTILWLFIPMIVIFVPVTGAVSYMLASDQLKSNAETSMTDTLSQTRNFMNDRLTALLAEMTLLDSNSEMRSIFYRAGRPDFTMAPEDYVIISRNLNEVYSDFYTVIDSILLYYRNGQISMYRRDSLRTDMEFDTSRFFLHPGGNTSEVQWLNLHPNELDPNAGRTASLYKWIRGVDGERTGIFLLQLKEDFFRSMLATPKISESGYLLLASPDGFVSFENTSGDYDLDDEQLRVELMRQPAESGKLELRSHSGKQMVVLYDTIPINKWRLAAIYPQAEIYKKVNYIQYVSLSVMAAVVLAVALLARVLANLIARPVTGLTHQINSIKAGNLEVQMTQPANNEIGVLSKGIEEMLERIKHLLAQVEYEQEQKRLSELAALQAQINPHFLYNTLYSIKQLCELGETKEASQMISALSNYFRISISKGNEMIPVETELEHVRQYLTIQQMRNGDSILYEIDVSQDIMDVPIVKLTLQPLVENAIYHGVKKVRRPGLIRITGDLEDDVCRIYVEDNGYGMSPERLSQLQRSLAQSAGESEEAPVGYGVRNVHRRLQLHYGNGYGLTFHSVEGSGTTVKVTFPTGRTL